MSSDVVVLVSPSKKATKSILKKPRLGKKKNKTRKVGWKENTTTFFHTYTPEEYNRKTPKWKECKNASQDVTDETTKQNTIQNSIICSQEESPNENENENKEKIKESSKKTSLKKGRNKVINNNKKKNIIII